MKQCDRHAALEQLAMAGRSVVVSGEFVERVGVGSYDDQWADRSVDLCPACWAAIAAVLEAFIAGAEVRTIDIDSNAGGWAGLGVGKPKPSDRDLVARP